MEPEAEKRACSAEPTKLETNITNLPTEILEIILKDYLLTLPSAELITLHTLGNNFANVVNHFLPKQKLCFNGCYTLTQEILLHVLSSQSKSLRVNINDCYWFNSSGISHLIASVPLQELHIWNFDLSFSDIRNILDLELIKLSIQWTSTWVLACKPTTDHSGSLWTALKSIKVLFKVDKTISDFQASFMRHCPNLKTIAIKPDNIEASKQCTFCFVTSDLENLIKIMKNTGNISRFVKLLKNEEYAEIKFKIVSEPPNISSQSNIEQKDTKNKTRAYAYQLYRNKYGCKKKKKYGFMFHNADSIENIWEQVACTPQIGDAVTALDLHNCQNMKLFATVGLLALVTGHMPNITYLDITMMPPILLTDQNKELVIESICELKYLKSLFMNAYFISVSAITNENVERFKNITSDAIRETFMWRLTTCCKSISFLKLIGNNKDQKNEYIYDGNLTAIGNLKNLLELHLVDILFMGTGASLSKITQKCKKLCTLQLKNVNFSEKQKYIEKSLKHAQNIRELSIYEEIELSEQLINYLSKCPQLEKLCLEGINVSFDQLEYFNKNILIMTNLYVLRLVTKNAIQFPMSLIKNLASIHVSKPAFLYLLKNKKIQKNFIFKIAKESNPIHNLIDLEWPPTHRNIFQYSPKHISIFTGTNFSIVYFCLFALSCLYMFSILATFQ